MLGIGQNGGEQCRVAARQARGGAVEEALRGRFGAIGTPAKFRTVQVHLENAPLWPTGLDQQGEVGFQALAEIAASRPKKQIFGDLLTDGAGAADLVAVPVELIRLLDGLDVESPVFRKLLILRCYDRQSQIRRNLFQVDPVMYGCIARIVSQPRLHLGFGHEGGERWIDPAQQQHDEDAHQHADGEHGCGEPQQPAQPRS